MNTKFVGCISTLSLALGILAFITLIGCSTCDVDGVSVSVDTLGAPEQSTACPDMSGIYAITESDPMTLPSVTLPQLLRAATGFDTQNLALATGIVDIHQQAKQLLITQMDMSQQAVGGAISLPLKYAGKRVSDRYINGIGDCKDGAWVTVQTDALSMQKTLVVSVFRPTPSGMRVTVRQIKSGLFFPICESPPMLYQFALHSEPKG
jgi:hypothetical protein